METMQHTVLLGMEDVSLSDGLGGKGENLLRLTREGYPVPAWFVVPRAVFDGIVDAHRDSVRSSVGRAEACHPDEIVPISAEIASLFDAERMDRSIRGALDASIGQTLRDDRTYAVRSSVEGEDAGGHSFAGLMDSKLHVQRRDIVEAICSVWASAFSPRALLYRRRRNVPLSGISAAVIVQEMVDSVSSGVLFTRHPETKARTCIISAGFGLGEGVVSNEVETDTYTVGWDDRDIERTVATKNSQVVRAATGSSGTRTMELSEHEAQRSVLDDTQVRKLAKMGRDLEALFGAPQDIEWAFDASGSLWLLQTRPIVFRDPVPEHDGFVRVWDSSNIVESYPGLTLPLTFSFVLEAYRRSFRRAAEGFFPFKKIPQSSYPIFDNMIGLLNGRVYYNLMNWYEMLSYLPGSGKHKDSWDQMIGISEKADLPSTPVPWYLRLPSAVIAVIRLLSVRQNARRFDRAFRSFYARMSGIRFEDMDPLSIVRAYASIRSDLDDFWYRTLHNDFAAMKYYGWLKELCAAWGPKEEPNLHNDLLCGERGVESVKPVRSLVGMCEMINADTHLSSLFEDENDPSILDRINRDEQCLSLKQKLEEHLSVYGDRGLEELKLERNTFRDDPLAVVRLLKLYTQQGKTLAAMDRTEKAVRERAERTGSESVFSSWKRIVLTFVLHKARCAVANRENMRFARTRLFGIIRNLFRCLGNHLVAEGLIDGPKDVFYLSTEEVFGAIRGTLVNQDLRSLVAIRKREYEGFRERPLPERFMTRGIPSVHLPETALFTGNGANTLKGTGCSSGIVDGEAVVVTDPAEATNAAGKILIARSTDPGWVFIMLSSKGIVVEKGSVLSHTAIIGRELGIPTIVGAENATRLIPNGSIVHMDGGQGEVSWH